MTEPKKDSRWIWFVRQKTRNLGVRNLEGCHVSDIAREGLASYGAPVDHGEKCSIASPHPAISPATAKS